MTLDKNFYPGFARKALSFSIDDGNLEMDAKFIEIVKPRGIKGAFNLTNLKFNSLDAEGYRDFYRGFEIANHCKQHPVTIDPNDPREFTDRVFNRDTADERYYYPHPEIEGIWYVKRHDFWCFGAKYEDYIRFADEGREEQEAIFGKGSVRGFVWPHGCCYDDRIIDHLEKQGYTYTRMTRHRDGDFSMPKDRMRIGMHGRSTNLPIAADDFLACPDDGQLKMLLFGVHSGDYERDDKWDVLRDFCDRFSDIPSVVWNATPLEIFDYEDALSRLTLEDGVLKNPTSHTLYVRLDGENVTVAPNSTITV